MVLDFYRGKRVLVTGHTGFKGSWLCRILETAGAEIVGYALKPSTNPSLFELSGIAASSMESWIGDIRDIDMLKRVFKTFQPEIVFHLAAQPIVFEGYKEPRYTYETNVMGTVNVLECVRHCSSVKSFLNVTTDKVYDNKEWCWGYRETDALDGFDPYSNSKSCSELVTHSYARSFFAEEGCAISTARAGNVIGGGDFSSNRIIPDCIRAVSEDRTIQVRNPQSIRPYQHVLEPLFAYLLIAQKQFLDKTFEGWYNIGPDDDDCVTTERLVDLFCEEWGQEASWEKLSKLDAPHEASYLKLDCSKIKNDLGWRPCWTIDKCIQMTVRFAKVRLKGGDIPSEMCYEIEEYIADNEFLRKA